MTHLTRDELVAWRDAPSDDQRARVIQHLALCDPCAGTYAELLRTSPSTDAPHFDPRDFVERGYAVMPPRARVLPFRGMWWIPVAAAAALALAVWLPGRGPAFEAVPTEAVRGTRLEAIAPRGDVRGPLEFHWSGASGSDRYVIDVADTAGQRVFQRETRDERLALDAAADAMLRPGVAYVWSVAALDAAGEIISRSKPATFVRAAVR